MPPSPPPASLRSTANQFAVPGRFRDARPYGNGHINQTFAAVFDQDGTAVRYLLQRINR